MAARIPVSGPAPVLRPRTNLEKIAQLIAQRLCPRRRHRHQLLADFLRIIGVNDKKVIYDDDEGMEHHISPESFQAIEALTRYLEKNTTLIAKAQAAAAKAEK